MSRRQERTYLMQLIEARHPGETIKQLIIRYFQEYGNERAASAALGVTQQTFNTWKHRLGLADQMSPPPMPENLSDK